MKRIFVKMWTMCKETIRGGPLGMVIRELHHHLRPESKGREELPQAERASCFELMLDRKSERRNSQFSFCPHSPVPSGTKNKVRAWL